MQRTVSNTTRDELPAVRIPPLSRSTQLEPVPVFDVTSMSDERTKTLHHLLERGHLLGSAYGLGASPEDLIKTYEHEVKTLIAIDGKFIRGDKISKNNWREFLQQKSYTVAFVDFFDKEVKRKNGNWEEVLQEYLYSGSEPLINGFIGGRMFLTQGAITLRSLTCPSAHPFIHLAYAYEFHSKEVATQALSLGCTEYAELHGLLDHYPTNNSGQQTNCLADIIKHVQDDPDFDGLQAPGSVDLGLVLEKRFDAVMRHWHAWRIDDPFQQLEQCCDLSVLLAISSGNSDSSFDFYYAHIMTVAHALRVLFHYFPLDRRVSILRQYALFVILIYVLQGRLSFGIDELESVSVEGLDWNWVAKASLTHDWALDDHFFKVVRATKVFAETYGDKDDFYLKAAIKFITQFRGWEGFGEES